VSIASLIPGLKGTGSRRAVDKVADLEAENRTLFTRQMAADDFFAQLMHDVVTTNSAWRQERERREIAEKERGQAEDIIRLRERRITDLERRLEVRVFAEAAAAKTQEIPVVTRVMPLREAAAAGRLGAVTDPGQVTRAAV
jgi:hypothetical protein